VVWASVAVGGELTRAQTVISEFETDFDGWQQQWHKESDTGTDGVATHSTERGYLDGTSLHFDMGDGFGDDGTLWIEQPVAISDTMPTHMKLEFQLFNEFQSDFNTFEVKAFLGALNPEEQVDFATIGMTDSAAGWVPFTYDNIINSPSGQAWVAVGVRVAWETHRDFWIDRVAVTTTVLPEPSTSTLLLLAFANALRRVRCPRL
jgi:hypothetical protein